jgi:hypothetical protein
MTSEQAIRILRKETSISEINALRNKGLSHTEVKDAIQDAMDLGADAIELQVPKEPNGNYCPNCDVSICGMGFKYCVECGQALII